MKCGRGSSRCCAGEGGDGRPATPHRPVIEGIVYRYRYRTGVAWRDLPREFGPWQTVWKRHKKSAKDGTWDRLLTALQAQTDADGHIDWRLSIDSSVRRVHQHGDRAEVGVGAVVAHRGLDGMTRIHTAGRTNRTITPSGGPAA